MVSAPPSLLDPALAPVWAAVRARLERQGLGNRGRVRLPELAPSATVALAALVGRPVTGTVDLAALEAGLVRLGVGEDLAGALDRLGHRPSPEPEARRQGQARQRAGRAAARDQAATWPEPWAAEWVEAVIRTGALRDFDESQALGLLGTVRRLLDHLAATDPTEPVSRVELAARLLGDAHALDTGTRLEVAVSKALALAARASAGVGDAADPWEGAGVHRDLVSGPVLTWNLPLVAGSALGRLARTATELGLPLHLTQLALLRHPVEVVPGAEVLVAENPRVVEAAAQRGAPGAVVTTSGNPSLTAARLVRQLVAGGAHVRYHGDFDAAGLAICARLAALGATPWRMGAADYSTAVAAAERDGVALPVDAAAAPPTPWDPALQAAFDERHLVVHEERLLDELLRGPSPR